MTQKKIPGIYNYCDRWCERCYFASRCSVYEDESVVSPEEKDLRNKAFWDRLAVNFTKAHQLLEQAAARYGVDLNTLAKNIVEVQLNEERVRKESENHPISKLSLAYRDSTHEWLKSQPGMMEKLEELRDGLTLGTASAEVAKSQTETIKDCLSVIEWYETFIHAKFVRALMGKIEDEGWAEDNGFQRDFDGSAKIAIMGIERSMQAWLRLYELLPDREDDFLKILGLLEKLKTMAIEEFPKAMDFKRPGFDD